MRTTYVANYKMKNKLRRIFNKYDIIKIYQNDKVNFDEYDPEINEIVNGFNKFMNKSEFLKKVHLVFIRMFGKDIAGNRNKYKKLSDEVYVYVKNHQSKTGGM